MEWLRPTQFLAAARPAGWRVLSDGAYACFPTATLAESAALVAAVAAIPGVAGAPRSPAIDVRHGAVTVRLISETGDQYGLTQDDLDRALAISAAAAELGLVADPARVQSILVVPGATDRATVLPFWAAILGYRPRADSPDQDLVDPEDRGPALWFERMDEPRGDGGGAVHLGVFVPEERARARVDAALAAGGRMVRDDFAPAWWTLADAAGNEADVGSIEPRDRDEPAR